MVIDISIIIVSYNTRDLLRECLSSIYDTIGHLDIEVIVVDNNSSDGSAEMVKGLFPEVILLQNEVNIGFAPANNQGIEIAKGRHILLLNPDTEVMENSIKSMYDFLEKRPDVGIVGCSIFNSNGLQYLSAGRFPNFFRIFTQSIFIDKLFTYLPKLKNYTINISDLNKVQEVDWATGACLMIRKKVFDDVGTLDGKYFLYFEEVDLCYRAKKAGWKIYFNPDAKIIHHLAQSTKQNFKKTIFEFYRSNYYYFYKNHSDSALFLLRAIISLGIILRYITWTLVKSFLKDKRKESLERLLAYKHALRITHPLRIAIDVSPLFSKAGIGHYASNLIQFLSNNSSKYTYVFLGQHRQFYGKNISFLKRIYYFISYLLWQYVFLPVELFMKEIDILHSTAYESPFWIHSHSVVTIHDMAFWLYPKKFTRFYQLRLKILVPFVAKRTDLIITDSEQSKKDISHLLKIKPEKIEVIYLGVNRSIFRPISDKEAIEKIRTKYRIGENRFILYIGTLEPRKNIVNLIKGYQKLRSVYNLHYKLVIVGMKGWLYSDIFKVTNELGLAKDIIFTDYVPDEELPFFYNAADLFVYPSLYEGFGLPVLEAMACGIPVVTSDTPSLIELVKDAAVTVNPYDIEGIAKAMYNVLTDANLKNRIITKGLLRAEEFSWEKTAEKTVEVYEKVLNRDGREIAYWV